MAADKPLWKFPELEFTGVLDESETPVRVGAAGGLTDCLNLFYRRYGSWSKRSGSGEAFTAARPGPLPAILPESGIRWYRAVPSELTQLVTVEQGGLFTGTFPGTDANPAALTFQQGFTNQNASQPCGFAPVFDPASNDANGADVLVITGVTGPYGFGTGLIQITGIPGTNPSGGVTVTVNGITAGFYSVLPTDNPTIIAENLSELINESTLVLPGGSPVLDQATYNEVAGQSGSANLHLGALVSGVGGNAITYSVAVDSTVNTGGGTLAATPNSPTHFTGGGASTSAPVTWDGNSVQGLSYQITRPFTNCVAWHNHLWLWGDPSTPDSLYASDINQPRGFVFMKQNGPYLIGQGQGDPFIQNCFPAGNVMFVVKTNSIKAIAGYDFQEGEYAFSVTDVIQGKGMPAPNCGGVLDNQLVFWTGATFERLAVGSFETEYIGATIPVTQGIISTGNPRLMRFAAGDFGYASKLNENFQPPSDVTVTEIMGNSAFFACDVGNGVADFVMVFDDNATRRLGNYAWSKWDGWKVDAFVPFGLGPNGGAGQDNPALYWMSGVNGGRTHVKQFGQVPGRDSGFTPIPWMAQTGWITTRTMALKKDMHRLFLEMEATTGVTIACTIVTPSNPPKSVTFPATNTQGNEDFQVVIAEVNPRLTDRAYMFVFTESEIGTNFEITSLIFEGIEEPYKP